MVLVSIAAGRRKVEFAILKLQVQSRGLFGMFINTIRAKHHHVDADGKFREADEKMLAPAFKIDDSLVGKYVGIQCAVVTTGSNYFVAFKLLYLLL
jgi:hypothetical protein